MHKENKLSDKAMKILAKKVARFALNTHPWKFANARVLIREFFR